MSIAEIEQKQKKFWKEWYLLIQGFFYFAQGAAMAAIFLLPVFMQEELGVADEKAITYQSIIMIPWYIKLLYGILSDNVSFGKFGRRRPYILIAGVLGSIGWVALPLFNTFNALFLIVGIFLSLSVALSDAVIDSLAVDITPENRRGWMQGVGWGGRGGGAALAGFVLGIIIEQVGWSVAYFVPGGLIILGCLLAMLYKEPEIILEETTAKFQWQQYKKEFSKKDTWLTTLFMILSGAGIAVISTYSTFLNQETGLTIEGIGLGVTFFSLGQFVGALIIGALGDLLALTPVLFGNTLLYIGGIASLIFIPMDNNIILYTIISLIGAINGGYEATQMRIGMEFSQGPIAGSMYNWFMSISNLGQITLGAIIIGQLAGPLGGYQVSMQFASFFLIFALVQALFLIEKIKKNREKKRAESDEMQSED
ncbi:MAG: MFS transporter [Asgard group archaeon]|nr:MFS transporter [Asgard group archaeon]